MITTFSNRIAALPTAQIKTLRENAVRLGHHDVAGLCDEIIAKRGPVKAKRGPTKKNTSGPRKISTPRANGVVIGFHFVCAQGKGVTQNGDGTAWTGTWVVDTVHAELGLKRGSYVALHSTKSEPSYLQGTIQGWRKARREREYAQDRTMRTEFGVDFLLALTSETYTWVGDGSGEKGYAWGKP